VSNGIVPDSTKKSNLITPGRVVKYHIGPIISVGSTSSGGSGGVNYSDYAKIIDLKTGLEYTGSFHSVSQPESDLKYIFDGDESTRTYAFNHNQWLGFRFKPPSPIIADGLIEIKAGFHSAAPRGKLIINDEVIAEFSAKDSNPQWFSATYTGLIYKIEVEQTNEYDSHKSKTFAINAFKIGGEYLDEEKPVTTLDFADGTDLSASSFYDHLQETDDDGNPLIATGILGIVSPTGFPNRITLTEINSDWNVGSYVESYEDPYGTYTPLYLENSEDVIKFNTIKTALDSYKENLQQYRVNLTQRLYTTGFSAAEISAMNLPN
jgi:hypothetical protein